MGLLDDIAPYWLTPTAATYGVSETREICEPLKKTPTGQNELEKMLAVTEATSIDFYEKSGEIVDD